MTASIADLLDRLHQQAFTISNLNTAPSPDRWRAQTVVWPKLASATIRAIRNINADEHSDQVRLLIGSILDPIARNEWLPKASLDGGPNVPPDRRLVDMTRVIGGIADLLAHGMDGVDTDPGWILGLRANLLSPVMVAADWSLATAPVVARTQTPRRHLQLVSGIGAVFAVVPPELRPGPYDDLAAIPHGEESLDAAIHNWLDATKDALALRKGLSGVTLQTIAADLSVICGAAATLTNAAIELHRTPEARGRPVVQALSAANAKWRDAARWPQSIYLGGVRDPSLTDASIHLRQIVVDTLREGTAWAEPRIIDGRMAGHDLLAIARRATYTAAEAGQLQQAAVTNLFWGRDRVMMAARALEGSAFMNKAVFEARRRGTWIPMPRYEPTGLGVYRTATRASNATLAALNLSAASVTQSRAPVRPLSPNAVDVVRVRISALGTAAPSEPTHHPRNESRLGVGAAGAASRSTGPVLDR